MLFATIPALLVSAAGLAAAQTNPATTSWTIRDLDFDCQTLGPCDSSFILDAPPGTFSLSCRGTSVPRGSKENRDCQVTQGANKIQSAQFYFEIKPDRPNEAARLSISVGIKEDPSNAQSTGYFEGHKDQDLGAWEKQKGKAFTIVPQQTASA